MPRFFSCHSAAACLIAVAMSSALASPPQRITGPLSVEPVMTVERPDTATERQPPFPLPVTPTQASTPELQAVADQPSATAAAQGPESLPLPAIERIPLGQGVVDASSDTSQTRPRFGGIAQTVGALAVVIGLILILRFVFVKLSGTAGGIRAQLGAAGKAPSGVLFVLGRYPVSRGMSLVLLQLDQRVLLLSQTSAGFHTLAELSDPSEVASIIQKTRDESGESLSAKFSGMLKQFERDPETLADLDESVPTQPVRLRHTGADQTVAAGPRQAAGFFEDKRSMTTGEDELRSRINRLREYGA